MRVRRHFRIDLSGVNAQGATVWGWKFENWHLYRLGWTRSTKNPNNRWRVWRKIF